MRQIVTITLAILAISRSAPTQPKPQIHFRISPPHTRSIPCCKAISLNDNRQFAQAVVWLPTARIPFRIRHAVQSFAYAINGMRS